MSKPVKESLIVKPSFEKVDDKGVFKELINDPSRAWTVANWGIKKKGAVMGNHYHKETEIFFFMVKGEAKVSVVDVNTKSREDTILKEGTGIFFKPYQSQVLTFLSESEFFMLKTKYDSNSPDTYEYKII
jgi:dTDP-4-dehydrorhamnose 3,5-epimerase-like enzyme